MTPMRRLLPLLPAGLALATPAVALAHGATAAAPALPRHPARLALRAAARGRDRRRGPRLPLAGAPGGGRAPRQSTAGAATWLFLGGLLALAVALLSPIEAYEGSLFSVHMVQHMLLELVAAPLLLAGAPDHPRPARCVAPGCGAPSCAFSTACRCGC